MVPVQVEAMVRSRSFLMVIAALAAALAFGGGHSPRIAAQYAGAALTCSEGAVGMDTCLVTLANGIPPGDSLTAAFDAPGATILGCESFSPGSFCAASADSMVVICPSGCPQGSAFEETVQIFAGQSLAQQFAVSGPVGVPAATTAIAPQMFDSCLSGVMTEVGCIPSASYIAYLQCRSALMAACSFDMGSGFAGYYFPSTATYAFYVPVGGYYNFYSPATASYYASYQPSTQFVSYWNPTSGSETAALPVTFTAAGSSLQYAGVPTTSGFVGSYFAPAISNLFLPAPFAQGSVFLSVANGRQVMVALPVSSAAASATTIPATVVAPATSVSSDLPPRIDAERSVARPDAGRFAGRNSTDAPAAAVASTLAATVYGSAAVTAVGPPSQRSDATQFASPPAVAALQSAPSAARDADDHTHISDPRGQQTAASASVRSDAHAAGGSSGPPAGVAGGGGATAAAQLAPAPGGQHSAGADAQTGGGRKHN